MTDGSIKKRFFLLFPKVRCIALKWNRLQYIYLLSCAGISITDGYEPHNMKPFVLLLQEKRVFFVCKRTKLQNVMSLEFFFLLFGFVLFPFKSVSKCVYTKRNVIRKEKSCDDAHGSFYR